MSLRSRKQAAMPNNDPRVVALKKGSKDYEKDAIDAKESVSPRTLMLIFVVICVLGGYREYNRAKIPVHTAASKQTSDKLTIPHPHRDLNPNFRSLLTPDEDSALEFNEADNTRYHIIFSTDCSPFQHWQSYLVFFKAMTLRQPGHVTRIASGCEGDEIKLMQDWFHEHIQGMSSRFHLHLTPSFSGLKNDQGEPIGDYKFFNKPFGTKHWMEHAEHMSLQQSDDIVILIDPDMLLLRPLTGDFSQDRDTVFSPKRLNHILGRKVEHGLPFAQTYGFGAQWQKLDLGKIAGPDSPAKQYNKAEANLYFPVGPPYIATVRDMYQVSVM